jgi:ABC-type transport system substrate-binding protein
MTPSTLFSSEVLFGGSEIWQLTSFSWKASEEPGLTNEVYLCDGNAPSGFGALNVTRYCSAEVDDLISVANTTLDYSERAALYNQIDAIYMDDIVSIPLYQKPELIAWTGSLTGPRLNLSSSTDLWNVGAWAGKDSVVVSIEEEPASLDPLVPQSKSAEMVLAALLAGAFSSDPELRMLPVLIESAEVMAGSDQ